MNDDGRSYEYDVATDEGQRRAVLSIRWQDGRPMSDADAEKALWALGKEVCVALAESMPKACAR